MTMVWVSLWSDEHVIKLASGDGCTTLGLYENHWIVRFEWADLWYVDYFSV